MSVWKRLILQKLVTDKVPKVSAREAHAAKATVLFLDTRSKDEYNISHIEGARLIEYPHFSLHAVGDLSKEQPLIVYCSIGKRSGEIGEKLLSAGFTHVKNLYGGLFEWINQGYGVVDAEGRETDQVHTYSQSWGNWLKRGKKVY